MTRIRSPRPCAGRPSTSRRSTRLVDASGSRPFFGTTTGGGGLFVKVLGRERSSDLLFRFYRWLRFRGLGDEAIASSLKQSIEHEALVSELAAERRHPHPRLLGVTEVDADRLALAFVRINGSSLDGVPAERLTDEVLRGSGAWSPTCIGPGSPTATCAWPISSSTTTARPG